MSELPRSEGEQRIMFLRGRVGGTVSSTDQYEVLREVFRITEWKDGAVYKTVSEGNQWVPFGTPYQVDGRIYAHPSSSYRGPAIRRKKR